MNLREHQELISAYLDGELAEDEQQRVEQLLAENVEARELLDELASVRESLRALPKYTVGEDLSRDVLSRAQQVVLLGAASDNGEPVRKADATVDAERPSPSTSFDWKRSLAWSALAVSAAVLIMLFSKPPQDATIAKKENAEQQATGAPDASDLKRSTPQMASASDAANGTLVDKQEIATEKIATEKLVAESRRKSLNGRDADVLKDKSRASLAGGIALDAESFAAPAVQESLASGKLQGASEDRGIAVFHCATDSDVPTADAIDQLIKPIPNRGDRKRVQRIANQVRGNNKRGKTAPETREVVFELEGTTEQLALALAQLESQTQVFHRVEVDSKLQANLPQTDARESRFADRATHGAGANAHDLVDAVTVPLKAAEKSAFRAADAADDPIAQPAPGALARDAKAKATDRFAQREDAAAAPKPTAPPQRAKMPLAGRRLAPEPAANRRRTLLEGKERADLLRRLEVAKQTKQLNKAEVRVATPRSEPAAEEQEIQRRSKIDQADGDSVAANLRQQPYEAKKQAGANRTTETHRILLVFRISSPIVGEAAADQQPVASEVEPAQPAPPRGRPAAKSLD